ncbi:hypothetical protein ACTI_66570 [Actinoplanes sp. OR16]|uniref:hypothetical protein n=1 Tax=Actinoplanes sp. OR16 TaxID=946334 RepID=UPI000F712978|nr:hypothetical protein [Actinoplanes sp. OR16]BBH69972.1 hypothetical protein ACTI_66570 [Actinoplanes sp. OR16]
MTTAEWVPDACTLPTADRPLRLAAFDDLFSTALRGQQRPSRTTLSWDLDPIAGPAARALTARESSCCSFFRFAFSPGGDGLRLDVTVPEAQVAVLDALQQRAAGRMRS